MTTGKIIKKPRPINSLALDARIITDEWGDRVALDCAHALTLKQALRLAAWLIHAAGWIMTKPKKKVRK